MTQLHAQPYDISATGFYFESVEEYQEKADKAVNRYGDPVEEFEIQFIDGERIDCELAEAIGLSQCTINAYFECVDGLEDSSKIEIIIAVGECGYDFDADCLNQWDVTVYHVDSFRDLAIEFVEEGIFGDISKSIENYIDYEAIARDLSIDYSEIEIDGKNLIYRCD